MSSTTKFKRPHGVILQSNAGLHEACLFLSVCKPIHKSSPEINLAALSSSMRYQRMNTPQVLYAVDSL